MGDLKLFRLKSGKVAELNRKSVAVEKSLQQMIEKHMEDLLAVRFLATEYYTGDKHRGRIDSLGLDEDGAPVIFEYKRSSTENVINQGLFYLDWLLDHKGEFTLLVQKRLGQEAGRDIEWGATRLICIAGDFTRYDEHAVQQINRNIELMRYGRYGDDLLALELVNVISATSRESVVVTAEPQVRRTSKKHSGDDPYTTTRISHRLAQASEELTDLYTALKDHLMGLGDDVQFKELKGYHAFKRIRNFACVEVFNREGKLTVYARIDPTKIKLENGFTRDVSSVGHWGTGNLEITLKTLADLKRGVPLLEQAYENA